MNMTLGQLIEALQNTGMTLDSEIRVAVDDGAVFTAPVREVVAGCDGVLLVLNLGEYPCDCQIDDHGYCQTHGHWPP